MKGYLFLLSLYALLITCICNINNNDDDNTINELFNSYKIIDKSNDDNLNNEEIQMNEFLKETIEGKGDNHQPLIYKSSSAIKYSNSNGNSNSNKEKIYQRLGSRIDKYKNSNGHINLQDSFETSMPTEEPTKMPTLSPTYLPGFPTPLPTLKPTFMPSPVPTLKPTFYDITATCTTESISTFKSVYSFKDEHYKQFYYKNSLLRVSNLTLVSNNDLVNNNNIGGIQRQNWGNPGGCNSHDSVKAFIRDAPYLTNYEATLNTTGEKVGMVLIPSTTDCEWNFAIQVQIWDRKPHICLLADFSQDWHGWSPLRELCIVGGYGSANR